MRVDVPRRRASCPSTLSSTSDAMNSNTPLALIHALRYQNRCPARTTSTRLASVTASAEMRVGRRAFATRHPSGRKKRRSAHSSTTGPLLAYTRAGLLEHCLHRGESLHRLFVRDDERRGGAELGIVGYSHDGAREGRVDN